LEVTQKEVYFQSPNFHAGTIKIPILKSCSLTRYVDEKHLDIVLIYVCLQSSLFQSHFPANIYVVYGFKYITINLRKRKV